MRAGLRLMRPLLGAAPQGAGAGTAYVALSFAVSGVLTYVFQSLSARLLGPAGYGQLALLWSATFLTVQVLWIGASQTLGGNIAEREARGRDWRPVLSSVRRMQALLLACFLLLVAAAFPALSGGLFGGSPALTAAFAAAVAAYAPEYFRRGVFGGYRQFSRLGLLHVLESASRAALAAALLLWGAGVWGPALAMVLAPLVAVALVRPASPSPPPLREPFSLRRALGFASPVLLCTALAQAFMNGGPLLVSLLGGSREQAGLLLAALILARAPQYVLSPAIAGLLPHASRTLAENGPRGLDRFAARAASLVAAAGLAMVAGVWLFGEPAMRLLYGPGFGAGRDVLVPLAALAGLYLLCEVVNQALFARGLGRRAALGWACGLPVAAACLALPGAGPVERVARALAAGVLAAALAQLALYLQARRKDRGR
ncbi:polysaccharide biosynthesis protein [Rubrobacter xylanophilus DSM 9941]|uniref:Polysaccharide biosynthesis protein n=1 Tax=Rubrobacter xylanophilus (strain DSM 9941 / JCM 11954 / NBRC 16129 / PRD-1) TaxID=266117 RepID=Q1AWM6_RUBXD|nr:oligosaccharide flippase family protein [Rubrobacter xylanophilus]ABG04202.1 polysaccharide biosynthesis protein [Rubrobacter xylanophilus DSM 9941]